MKVMQNCRRGMFCWCSAGKLSRRMLKIEHTPTKITSAPMSTAKEKEIDTDNSLFKSSNAVVKIEEWLRESGITDFEHKRSQPYSFVNTGLTIMLKGGYNLSIITDPNITFGQYAETGILKDGNLIEDKEYTNGECILRHDSHEEVVGYIAKIIAATEAGELKNTRDHNF